MWKLIKLLLFSFYLPYLSALSYPKEILYLARSPEVGSYVEAAVRMAAEPTPQYQFRISGTTFETTYIFNITSYVCDSLSKKPIFILSQIEGRTACSIAAAKGIPCLTVSDAGYADFSGSSIDFYPSYTSLVKAYSQVVGAMGWNSATILYSDYGRVRELELSFARILPSVNIKIIPKENEYRNMLKEIKSSGVKEIVVDSSSFDVYNILKEAKNLGMMKNYHYLITSLDLVAPLFEEFGELGAEIIAFRIVDPSRAGKFIEKNPLLVSRGEWKISKDFFPADLALVVDATVSFVEAFRDVNEMKEAVEPHTVDCTSSEKWEFGSQIMSNLKEIEKNGMTGKIEFDEWGRRFDCKLDVVRMGSGVVKLGEWTEASGLKLTPQYNHRTHSSGQGHLWNRTIVVTTVLSPPYVMMKGGSEGSLGEEGQFEGYSIDVMQELSKILSFDYRITLAHDSKYGSYNQGTGQWNGMIGDIMNKKADMAISDLTITSGRQEAVDFTIPIMNTGISILYKKPTSHIPDFFFFLQPWSLNLWLYICSATTLVALLFYILAKMSPFEEDNSENGLSFGNAIWYTIGTGGQQGSHIIPRALSTRIAATFWFFFVMIMARTYIANMSAMLSNKNLASPIQSVEDLVRQNSIKYGCVRGGATAQFFKNSDYPTYQRVWAAMDSEPSVFSASSADGVMRVSNSKGKYAFFMESSSIQYVTERHCDLLQIGGPLDSKGFGIALPKESPHRAVINTALLKMQETGKLMALKTKWWKYKNGGDVCNVGPAEELQGLEMDNLSGLFATLMIGLVTAFIVGLIEFFWASRRSQKTL